MDLRPKLWVVAPPMVITPFWIWSSCSSATAEVEIITPYSHCLNLGWRTHRWKPERLEQLKKGCSYNFSRSSKQQTPLRTGLFSFNLSYIQYINIYPTCLPIIQKCVLLYINSIQFIFFCPMQQVPVHGHRTKLTFRWAAWSRCPPQYFPPPSWPWARPGFR